MSEKSTPYEGLSPDTILDCVEAVGLRCSGQLLALNSYENRVYQIGVEDEQPIVAKFYRPGRWSEEAILEEHAFSLELAEREIPVVAPLVDDSGRTLHHVGDFRFALFPRRGGRAPELDNEENLEWLGRFMGRMHAVGAAGRFKNRPRLQREQVLTSRRFVLDGNYLPDYLRDAYESTVQDLYAHIERCFESAYDVRYLRIHGDCHPGNILWTDQGPHFVDLDDTVMGPAIQDLWMLLSGERHEQERQMEVVLRGYTQFFDFDPIELMLIEPLRAMRYINYAAWVARRWDDPAFPQAFPWFNTPRYWEEHVQGLRELLAQVAEPALRLDF